MKVEKTDFEGVYIVAGDNRDVSEEMKRWHADTANHPQIIPASEMDHPWPPVPDARSVADDIKSQIVSGPSPDFDELWSRLVQKHTIGGSCNFRNAASEMALIQMVRADGAKEVNKCLAQPVTESESSPPTTPRLPMPEPADFRTLQDRMEKQEEVLTGMCNMAREAMAILSDRLESIEALMNVQSLKIHKLQADIQTLTAALAEDQDPDEVPQTYLDGSKI